MPAEDSFVHNASTQVVCMNTIPAPSSGCARGATGRVADEVLMLSLVTNVVFISDTYRSIKAEVEAEVCDQTRCHTHRSVYRGSLQFADHPIEVPPM